MLAKMSINCTQCSEQNCGDINIDNKSPFIFDPGTEAGILRDNGVNTMAVVIDHIG